MLALKSKLSLAVLVGSLSIGNLNLLAQQTPSQRYEPVQQNPMRQNANTMAPPSVHIPQTGTRQLSNSVYHGAANPHAPNSSDAAQFTFSDMASQDQTPSNFQPGSIQQTAYEINENGEPIVPEVLAAPKFKPAATSTNPVVTSFQASTKSPATSSTTPNALATSSHGIEPRRTPESFAPQMNQMRTGATQANIPGSPSTQKPATTSPHNPRIAPDDFGSMNPIRSTSTKPSAANQLATPKAPTTSAPAASVAAGPTAQVATTSPTSNESASEFIAKLNSTKATPATTGAGNPRAENSSTQPPATMLVPRQQEAISDSQVRTVSAESEATQNATIDLKSPSIEVQTVGPQTIGINKPASYQVVVNNISNIPADKLQIAVNLPAWIDITNINMTAGEKEVGSGPGQARLLWKLDRLAGSGTQTMTITTLPRKAEMFDLGIEWRLAARTGTANITVTEPRLEMTIVGPDEVQYGEQALYHVTVRNPGTGTAENVVVMLPEALGGERATLGDISPGADKNFQVELLARTAGQLDLIATAVGEGSLEVTADRKLTVRRAVLGIAVSGPQLKYAGSDGQFVVNVTNTGDATAHEIVAAMALPSGVKYLGGIESVKLIDGGLRWVVGALQPGETREYRVTCQLDTSGDIQLEVGAQAKGDLQAANACVTHVETVADLVLSVRDPKGPLPTGQPATYEINIRNRGSRAAKSVNLVMQFSEGIEPKQVEGLEHRLVPGQVLFAPIAQLDPGQEMTFKVNAEAFKGGTHIFRAQLICEEADSRKIVEGTTRFFGDEIRSAGQSTANSANEFSSPSDPSSQFQR